MRFHAILLKRPQGDPMRKSVVSIALAGAFAAPGIAAAQSPAPAASPIAGNIALVSDYRFRGISQTFHKPALQGGFDYAHSSGLYLGNWNSNVSEGAGFPGSNLEMDFYGGWKKAFGDFGLDVGFIYYYYPGSDAGPGIAFSPANNVSGAVHSGTVDNKEIYIGGTWKFLSLKYYHAIDDYFSAPGTDGTSYIDVTKDISGWIFGAAYIDTNAKGDCGAAEFYCFANSSLTETKDAGKSTVVLSVSKTF
jgi:uncharacterized protein (TIGR02001 family)